jgi:hypothetical protein
MMNASDLFSAAVKKLIEDKAKDPTATRFGPAYPKPGVLAQRPRKRR